MRGFTPSTDNDMGKTLMMADGSITEKKSCKEISFTVPWGVIAAKAWGPENGKPFLGLHGWIDNANTFDRLALLLPKDVYFVAIDLPGHGKSSHRWPGMPYIHFEYIADVKKVVSQLGWKTFSFIGHSMGANIASLYAGTFSGEVENLVLFDFGGPPIRPLNQTALVLARYATRMSDAKKTSRVYPSLESAAERRQVPFLGTTLCKEDAMLLSKRGTRITRNGVMFTHDPDIRALYVPFFIPQHSLLSILSNIQCSVLTLEGTDTLRLDYEEKPISERLDVIYNSACFKLCKKIKGGHYFHLERPELVAHEIKQFLALSCTSQGSSGKSKL